MLAELQKKYDADKLDSDLAMHCLDVYEQFFNAIRERPMKILEIGVHKGGSLRMWAEYFPNSRITGVDIDPDCKRNYGDRIQVVIGDQADRDFLNKLGTFDIIVDDGGHTMVQQKTSLDVLWGHLHPGGVYVLEDLETSYWPKFGGSFDRTDTTIEHLKKLVDNLNWRGIDYDRAVKKRKRLEDLHIKAIHFYPSLCLIEKEAA
jgi:predicted O-methyltransferase YrrM